MSRQIHYTTINLDQKEEILLQFILSLDNAQEKTVWTHTTTSDAPLVIIGNCAPNNQRSLSSQISSQQIVLSLGNKTVGNLGKKVLLVNTPLQAREVIEQLEHAETLIPESQPKAEARALKKATASKRVDSTSKIKLLSWPSSELLMRHSVNTSLATLLNKEVMSIKEMSEKVQYPEMPCRQFVEAAIKMGCAQALLPAYTENTLEKPSPQVSPQRKGLFASLGLSKN